MKEFNYKINGAPYKVFIRKSDAGMVELEVNGTPFAVEIETKEKKKLAGIKRPNVAPAGPTPQSTSTPLVTRPSAPGGKNSIQSPLPQSFISKLKVINNARLSLIGRNLLFLYNKAPYDPETTLSTSGNGGANTDNFGLPATRTIGFSLNVNF